MDKDYKIEVKPSLWVVTLESGCYSDWEIEYLFFHANDEDEVWNFLCRYFNDNYDDDKWFVSKAISWGEKKYIADKVKNKENINWDNAKEVKIERLKVIEFKQ